MNDISPKQLAANQQNAQKSTGPKTSEGKAISKHNALKHGLLTRDMVLPTEDAEMLTELTVEVWKELKPVGQLEQFLVERIVANMWRIKRLHRIETGLFTTESVDQLAGRIRGQAREFEHKESLFPNLEMETTTITDEKKHAEIIAKAEALEKTWDSDITSISSAFRSDAVDNDVLAKIIRYEVSLERSFTKALHELQRLQAKRNDDTTPPPVAVDVDISGENNGFVS